MPSLLGGLKRNPWLRVNAIVTITEILERLTEAAFKIEIDLTKGGGK